MQVDCGQYVKVDPPSWSRSASKQRRGVGPFCATPHAAFTSADDHPAGVQFAASPHLGDAIATADATVEGAQVFAPGTPRHDVKLTDLAPPIKSKNLYVVGNHDDEY